MRRSQNIGCEKCAINRLENNPIFFCVVQKKKNWRSLLLLYSEFLVHSLLLLLFHSLAAHKIPSLWNDVTSNLRNGHIFSWTASPILSIFFSPCVFYEQTHKVVVEKYKNKSVNTVNTKHRTVNIILTLAKQNVHEWRLYVG